MKQKISSLFFSSKAADFQDAFQNYYFLLFQRLGLERIRFTEVPNCTFIITTFKKSCYGSVPRKDVRVWGVDLDS